MLATTPIASSAPRAKCLFPVPFIEPVLAGARFSGKHARRRTPAFRHNRVKFCRLGCPPPQPRALSANAPKTGSRWRRSRKRLPSGAAAGLRPALLERSGHTGRERRARSDDQTAAARILRRRQRQAALRAARQDRSRARRSRDVQCLGRVSVYPMELENLAGAPVWNEREATLRQLLAEQCARKRPTPSSGAVPGESGAKT